MSTATRTPQEQQFWDAAFQAHYPDCVKRFRAQSPEHCAHLAREIADAALVERRRSQEQQP